MSDLTRSQWNTLLTDASGRTFGDLVAALRGADEVTVDDPDQCVDDAIATGPLEEDPDAGVFGEIHLDGEPPEPENTDDSDPEEPVSTDTNPGSKAGESDTDEDISKYRRVYLDAADRADREPWEYVEEDAIRAALANIGFAELLDNGTLFDIHEWKYIDVSDDGEEPRRRWYCPSGDEPRPAEFRRFHTLLTETAPDGYEPHYFRVRAASKAPATRFGGWKETDARLSVDEAVEWMEQGGNVGIAGRGGCRECGGNGIQNDEPCSSCDGTGENPDHDGPLVNVDIDDDEETTPDDVPTSLRARSRSRTGWHTWYFDHDGEIPNIPTDDYGEIRTNWQYVVAPGSFVASTSEEIPDDAADAGYYTIADEASVASIDYDELPEVFRSVAESDPDPVPVSESEREYNLATDSDHDHDHDNVHEPRDCSSEEYFADESDDRSAVFDIEAVDLVPGSKDPSERFTSIFHESDTGANMAVSNDKVHCWRHGVAHGGLQALCVLSDVDQVSTYGCRELGAEHSNSNAGVNALRGNWRLVWGAWHYAKQNNYIDKNDAVPYRVLRELAVDDGIVAREDLVVRDTENGGIVDDPDAHEGDTYPALPSGTYNEVLSHIEDTYNVDPGRDPISGTGGGDSDHEEHRSDPTDLAATVDPRRAWDAAGRVSPGDLTDHDLPVNDDAGSFACPCCGEPVDVVRAVAIDTGLVDSCEDSLDETYPTAYDRARSLGAPLPEYYTEWDAIARFDALLDVIGEVTFWDLDTDAILSEVTGTDDDVNGDAVRTLNPSWRESDSEASVLVFPSGTIWDADTERVLDAVRFAAVDSGLIEDPTAPVEGSTFTQAYRRCRNYYDAPLPRWNPAGGDRTVTPDLPDGRDLVDTRDVDGVNVDALENARERVENLVGDAVSLGGDTDNTPTVVTSLPATGKTTAAIKSARDGPRTYLAPRKELQQQAVDKADRWGVDAYVLPVLSEENIHSDVLERAVAFVREHDQQQLRNREAILEATMGAGEGEVQANEIFEEDDDEDDDVDLDRATCPTAEGEHGAAWALAVHTAKKLGHTPQEVHMNAQGIFGESLPCTHDGTCEYGDAWSVVTSRDNCPELLVGSYVHAHVESVRTHYERDSSGDGIERSPRPLVFDEFIGEAFTTEVGPEALDFATWLAQSLRADVADRRDMFDADLWSDPWVRSWLKGRLGESRESESNSDDPILAEVERVIHALSRVGDVLDARDSAADMVSEYGGALEELSVRSTLTEFVDGTTPADKVFGALEDLTEGSVDEDLQNICEWIVRDVHVPLRRATKAGTEPADAGVRQVEDTSLPIGGDLADLVADAFDAAEVRGDAARARIEAAVTALQGGPDGCRRLAAWADDGYAHPDAHHVLRGVITPTGDDSDVADADATRVNTSNWTFDPDADEGTVVDVVSTAGDATTIVDRNDHGARLHTPPSRTSGTGEQVPVVGLDATGRAALWRVVLGTEVRTTDIFDSARERRQFLEDALDLRVIQAADMPRYYEGDPATKDTDGDVALLEAIAEEYSGIQAPRQRGEEPQRFGSPAAITTKSVREVLESDPRLDDVVDAWDNYGNVTGKNELGDHRLAAILGCQHFGDDTIEQFAALAGEEVDTDREVGRGAELDYDSDVANAYLKHMTEDKTMQAILRFARGEDGGATVVARTSALRADLPVVGRGDVVETWSDTATNIVEKARSLGREFTSADVRPAVDVKNRQVRRVLSELVDAGYLQRTEGAPGRAHSYERVDDPGAGEVSIPERDEAVPDTDLPGHSSSNTYYTRNVRVFDPDRPREDDSTPGPATTARAPPAPGTIAATGPPG